MPDSQPAAQLSAAVGKVLAGAFQEIDKLPEMTWSFARGTARVFVSVKPLHGRNFVQVRCPVLADAPGSSELFEYVATHADDYLFGHLSCDRRGGLVYVFLTHVLSTTDLQEAELVECVDAVIRQADQIDEQLVELFGGRTFRQ